MKSKTLQYLFLITSLILFIAVLIIIKGDLSHGDISAVKVDYGTSQTYTKEELDNVVNIIKEDFYNNFGRCVLYTIKYGGDKNHGGYTLNGSNKSIVVFYTSFKTDAFSDNSLEPNRVYNDYMFIFASSKRGEWNLISKGYA